MLSEVVERKREELERAKSIRRMYKEHGDMSVMNISKLHEVPYKTAYSYVRKPEAEWEVFIMHKEKLLRDAEERLKAEGGTNEELKPIEEPKAEEDAAVETEEPKAEEAEPVREQLKPWKTKLEEIEARLMPRKIEPEEPLEGPKAAEAEEPEAFRAESAVIRPEAIGPAPVGSFGVCENCGAEIMREDARFCWNCGHDIRPKRLKYADRLRYVLDKTASEESRHALEYAIEVLEAGRW